MSKSHQKILLHVCCAPCAGASVERLQSMQYEVVLFFSNSNIYPKQEYNKRLQEVKRLADLQGLELKEDVYDHKAWLMHIRGLESAAEGGKRCEKCFEYNLARSARMADHLDIPAFTTTLTISPHKSSKTLFAIGNRLNKFVPIDFKKKDGFLHSLRLCKTYQLYRQTYCGCEFSKAATAKDRGQS